MNSQPPEVKIIGEPKPADKIQKVYCWIAITENGGEGIVGRMVPLIDGSLHPWPMFAGTRDGCERMAPMIEQIKTGAAAQGINARYELREFTAAIP